MFRILSLSLLVLGIQVGLCREPRLIGAPPVIGKAICQGSSPYRDGQVFQYVVYLGTNQLPVTIVRFSARVPADAVMAFARCQPADLTSMGTMHEWSLYSVHANLPGGDNWIFASKTQGNWVALVFIPVLDGQAGSLVKTAFGRIIADFSFETYRYSGIRAPTDVEVLEAIQTLENSWKEDPYGQRIFADTIRPLEVIIKSYATDNNLNLSPNPYREWMDPLAYTLEFKNLKMACVIGGIKQVLTGKSSPDEEVERLYHPLPVSNPDEKQKLALLRENLDIYSITSAPPVSVFPGDGIGFTPWSQQPSNALVQLKAKQIAADKTEYKTLSPEEQFFKELDGWLKQAEAGYYYSSTSLTTNLTSLNLVPLYVRWLNSATDPDKPLAVPPPYTQLAFLNPATTAMTSVPDALAFIDRGWRKVPGPADFPAGFRQQINKVKIISPMHSLLSEFVICPPVPDVNTITITNKSALMVLTMSDQELQDALWVKIKQPKP